METSAVMEAREYQKKILDLTLEYVHDGSNVLIELDCGLGKRFIQYSLIGDIFRGSKILLILQASTSLYETYNYLKNYLTDVDMVLIDSRLPSKVRGYKLKQHQVVLCLPQTLSNTLKQVPDAIDDYDLIVINEVDQIIRRMGYSDSFKQPYPKLMPFFENKKLIGMSGTLRDTHYILDREQMRVKKELESLLEIMGSHTRLIEMDMLQDSDLEDHISMSEIIPTGIEDVRMEMVSAELDSHIIEAKETLLQYLKHENPALYTEAKSDMSKLFGPLPVPPKLAQNFHRGYLVRKYLWSMSGEKSFHHLANYGVDRAYVKSTLPVIPGKFHAVHQLVKPFHKSVILCSYLDTVALLNRLIQSSGIATVQVTGDVPHAKRGEALETFRNSEEQMVAILSNVGERDLDIPEAEQLIVFDLIRTTKTVYQKLKRSRGGICRIMYYSGTREENKVKSVVKSIMEKYSWSTEIKPTETYALE